MSPRIHPFFFVIGLGLATQTAIVYGDDKPQAAPGCHLVPIKSNGKTIYIQVQDQGGSSRQAGSFSSTSSFANKTFSSGPGSYYGNNPSLKKSFLTKSYAVDRPNGDTVSNLNTRVPIPSLTAYNQGAEGFDKSFATSSDKDMEVKAALLAENTTTSKYQGQSAVLEGKAVPMPASTTLAPKPYLGPEVSYARRDIDSVNQGLTRMSGLPNRSLTIDEVRDLINHESKPNTDEKPPEPTKALNDPDYKPTANPAIPSAGDEKDGDVPSPGMMSMVPVAPENSEPLPKK